MLMGSLNSAEIKIHRNGVEIDSQRFAHPAGPNGSLEAGGLGKHVGFFLETQFYLVRCMVSAWCPSRGPGGGGYMDDP